METVMTKPVVITDMKKKASDILLAISWRELANNYFTSHHPGSTTRWTASTEMEAKEDSRPTRPSSCEEHL